MYDLKEFEVWFVTGSQHLYGPERWKRWLRIHARWRNN